MVQPLRVLSVTVLAEMLAHRRDHRYLDPGYPGHQPLGQLGGHVVRPDDLLRRS